MVYIKGLDYYRDGGSIGIMYSTSYYNEELDFIQEDKEIIINNGFGGDGLWYNNFPSKGGILVSKNLKSG